MSEQNEKHVKTRIVHKHDIAENWEKAENFVPKQGELIIYDDRYTADDGSEIIVADAVRYKIGDGVSKVNKLPLINNMVLGDGDKSLIGNDTKTNKAISENASAFGTSTSAGSKGYRIIASSGTSGGTGTYTLQNYTGGYANGDTYSLRIGNMYDRRGKITAINGNVITVSNYAPESLSVLIKGSWVFNANPTSSLTSNVEISVKFRSNSKDFTKLTFGSNKTISYSTTSDTTVVFSNGQWTNSNYKTIDFGEVYATINKQVYSVIEAAATSNGGTIATDDKDLEDRNTFRVEAKPLLGDIDIGKHSAAFGLNSQASGFMSFTEGLNTNAYGKYSHAEGNTTEAAYAAHSEGRGTHATGQHSHAEGYQTTASNNGSHAEGAYTQASGSRSHAEGQDSVASGDKSHAEGHKAISKGEGSHAEGMFTYASGKASHVEGLGATDSNGNVLTTLGAQGQHSHAEGNKTLASNDSAHAEGEETVASGKNSHAEGYHGKSSGDASHTEGYQYNSTSKKTYGAQSTGAHAEGVYTTATTGEGSNNSEGPHAEGKYTLAKGEAAHAEGRDTQATAKHAHAEGSYTIAEKQAAHAEGQRTKAAGIAAHAEGSSILGTDGKVTTQATASGDYSHAEGHGTSAEGQASHAEGYATEAFENYSHAEGKYSITYGEAAHAEGSSNAYGSCSHAEGASTYAYTYASHAEGASTYANGEASHAEGDGTNAYGRGSHVEGINTVAGNSEINPEVASAAHAEGYAGSATGTASHVEGYQDGKNSSNIKYGSHGKGSHAEGFHTIANAVAAHAEGSGTQASGIAAHAEGDNSTASSDGAHAEGAYTQATGSRSHAEGGQTQATGSYSHAEGYNDKSTISIVVDKETKSAPSAAVGSYSHTEGNTTRAYGQASHAEGSKNIAMGTNSHVEGNGTIALGEQAHAEGMGTIAKGSHSHAEGYQASDKRTAGARGTASHTEGVNTTANAQAAHAEGTSTIANGTSSHAEGDSCKAYTSNSHAEGTQTEAGSSTNANNTAAHAEGYKTKASGTASHAEGDSTIASGNRTHAEGRGTVATVNEQHVQGRYNQVEKNADGSIKTSGDYAHIVGGGESDTNRWNIHTLDWKGKAWYKDSVYVGGSSADKDSKKLITADEAKSEAEKVIDALPEVVISGSYNDLSNKPTSMKNPESLTIQCNGETVVSYEGETPKTINIQGDNVVTDENGNITISSPEENILKAVYLDAPKAFIHASEVENALGLIVGTRETQGTSAQVEFKRNLAGRSGYLCKQINNYGVVLGHHVYSSILTYDDNPGISLSDNKKIGVWLYWSGSSLNRPVVKVELTSDRDLPWDVGSSLPRINFKIKLQNGWNYYKLDLAHNDANADKECIGYNHNSENNSSKFYRIRIYGVSEDGTDVTELRNKFAVGQIAPIIENDINANTITIGSTTVTEAQLKKLLDFIDTIE